MTITADDRAFDPARPIGPDSLPLLAAFIREGCKPRAAWASGAELELFGYYEETVERIDPATVEAVLVDCAEGGDLRREGKIPVEASVPAGLVTVEPGGQIEFSGAYRGALRDVEEGLAGWLQRLARIAEHRNIFFVACGFDPLRSATEQRWYPKRRYAIMRPYLRARGRRAWDMMTRTASIQANVDYGSVEDLARKFAAGNRLGPVVAAMFANSPFENGRLSGYKSTRYAAWLETDPDRSGVSPPAIDEHFSPERFVDYVLSVPMLFVRRDGEYLDRAGAPFAAHLAGAAPNPIFQDFSDHLTTIFTEARLKQHVELRSADAGPLAWALALQAFWKGLLYDPDALDAALGAAPRLGRAEFRALQEQVARNGLAARGPGVNVLALARELAAFAREGLGRVAPDEVGYLDPLLELTVDEGLCPADVLVKKSKGDPRRALWLSRVA
jgi:glutamate--cysteine ligase